MVCANLFSRWQMLLAAALGTSRYTHTAHGSVLLCSATQLHLKCLFVDNLPN